MSSINLKSSSAIWEQPKSKKVAFKINSSSTATLGSFSKPNLSLTSSSKMPIKPVLKIKSKFDILPTVPEIKLQDKKRPNAFSERYRFLNDGIVAECRKWERLQDRALALHEHKKLLTELRWKMVLNDNFKKLNKSSKDVTA